MGFALGNLFHWKRNLGWQEKLKEKLWKHGSLPLTTIKIEVLLCLAFQNLQGLHHNNWKEKREKWFCYICHRKYTKGHKYDENNYFT